MTKKFIIKLYCLFSWILEYLYFYHPCISIGKTKL